MTNVIADAGKLSECGKAATRLRICPEEVEEVPAGNPKPPPPEVYLQWVLDAWESVKTDVIVRSLKACGIFIKPDGIAHAVGEDLPQLMQGLEVEAPEDPEDDAGKDSDVSVISAGDQGVEESDDGEYVEEDDSDSDFLA